MRPPSKIRSHMRRPRTLLNHSRGRKQVKTVQASVGRSQLVARARAGDVQGRGDRGAPAAQASAQPGPYLPSHSLVPAKWLQVLELAAQALLCLPAVAVGCASCRNNLLACLCPGCALPLTPMGNTTACAMGPAAVLALLAGSAIPGAVLALLPARCLLGSRCVGGSGRVGGSMASAPRSAIALG